MIPFSKSWVDHSEDIPHSNPTGRKRIYKKSDVIKFLERNPIKPRKPPLPLTDEQLLDLTNPLENPYLESGGETSEMGKTKNKTRFSLGYGGHVFIRPYSSGNKSWGMEYRDENNERITRIVRNAQTYEEAVVACREAQKEVFDRQYNIKRKKERIKFNEFADMYLDYAEVNKEKSWKTDRSYINNMKNFFGNPYLDEIGQRINGYTKWRSKQKAPYRNTSIKNATVDRGLAVLSGMFSLAVEWGYLSKEQVPKIKYLPVGDNSRKQTLSWEEEKRLFQAFKESPDYLEPIIITALYNGLRRREVFNLMWKKNIDFKNREFTLEGSQTKNGKDDVIPIHPRLFSWLVELHKKNGQSPYVFPSPRTGKPLTNVDRSFKSACKRAGIEGFIFHSLRHTYGTRLLVEEKNDLVTVKELMRHSSVKMTERYLHSNRERKRKAIESLGNNGLEKELKKTENREDLLLNCNLGKSQMEEKALSYLFSGEWE